MTAVGRITLARTYRITGRNGSFPADLDLGIAGDLSRGAQRMATLAGLQRSFAHAEDLLRELSGWDLDDNTIRKVTHQSARRAAASRPARGDAARFAAAEGAPEVAIDAGKVNALTGWRDVKFAANSKRVPALKRIASASPRRRTRRSSPTAANGFGIWRRWSCRWRRGESDLEFDARSGPSPGEGTALSTAGSLAGGVRSTSARWWNTSH